MKMTRREFAVVMAAAGLSSADSLHSGLSVEGYIFQQYAESRKQTLASVIGDVLPMAKAAGFRNLELSPPFLQPDILKQTRVLIHSLGLAMPSLYVGGTLHEQAGTDQTISNALHFASICAPFGCKAIVTNPDPKPDEAAKTDSELAFQSDSLNRMGRALADQGFELRVHHHTPQLTGHAREWRHILNHTDSQYVHICVDVDWAYEGGFEPVPFLQEVGSRLREIHVRSARNKLWLEDVEDSDIDYRKVAEYLTRQQLTPLIVVELAYRPATIITRSLEQDLRLSRLYTERVFASVLTQSI